jgi:site-specific DNA recombinase
VAYCRVSTEEQAEEGYSIDGQADRLQSYAELHELGPVTVVEDPGLSGKDLKRPGLQQVLAMVEAGHCSRHRVATGSPIKKPQRSYIAG